MTQSAEIRAEQRVYESLWKGAMTRLVKIGVGTFAMTGKCLDRCFPSGSVIVIADSNTYQAAGQKVCRNLRQDGRKVLDPFIFEDDDLDTEYRFVERLKKFLTEPKQFPWQSAPGRLTI